MKIFKEFKEFISRGNVLDMAVGVIIGSAFTAIINAIVTGILKPLINSIPGSDKTSALIVVLREAVLDDKGEVLTEAVIIDFGAVISAIITFFITAIVLFIIIKMVNSARNGSKQLKDKRKKKGEEPVAEAEPAPAPAPQAPTTDELLTEIRDLLKAQNTGAVKAEIENTAE